MATRPAPCRLLTFQQPAPKAHAVRKIDEGHRERLARVTAWLEERPIVVAALANAIPDDDD